MELIDRLAAFIAEQVDLITVDGLYWLFMAVALTYPAVTLTRWFKRRGSFQEFARSHQLRFVGVIPSDKRAPYIYFERVRTAVLLYHVMEGRWEEFEIAVFDAPQGRRPLFTEAIVSLPSDVTPFRVDPAGVFNVTRAAIGERLGGWTRIAPSHRVMAANMVVTATAPDAAAIALGAQASAVLASRPDVTVETHFSYLRVSPRRKLESDELPEFLRFVATLARAMMGDARTK